MPPGRYLEMPKCTLDRATILDLENQGGFVKLFWTIPGARHAGCFKATITPAQQRLFQVLYNRLKSNQYPSEKMKKYTLDNTTDSTWVKLLDVADVKDEYVGLTINKIFKLSDKKIANIIKSLPEDLSKTKTLCYGKAKIYFERMTLKQPLFENLIQLEGDKIDAKPPIIPSDFGFNLNFASSRYEMFNQTYGRGDGITHMWCYLKVYEETITEFHAETHNQGGINIFCGKGFAAWHAVSPNDFDKVKQLYLDKWKKGGVEGKVGRNDYFTKLSAPTIETLLKAGVDVYWTKQQDGDMVMTLPGCIHSVHNFASGFAMARNHHCDEFYKGLSSQIQIYNDDPVLRFGFPDNQALVQGLLSRMSVTDPLRISLEKIATLEQMDLKSISVRVQYTGKGILTLDEVLPKDVRALIAPQRRDFVLVPTATTTAYNRRFFPYQGIKIVNPQAAERSETATVMVVVPKPHVFPERPTPQRTFICKDCGFIGTDRKNLESHARKHKKMVCNACGEELLKNSWYIHKETNKHLENLKSSL